MYRGVEARRHAEVRGRDHRGKRVHGGVEAPGVGLERQGRGDLVRERVLAPWVELAEQDRVVDGRIAAQDRVEQGVGALAQLLEHRPQLGRLHPRLEVVEQRVIRVLVLEALAVAPAELDHALEVGEEVGEARVLPRLLPRVLGDRRGASGLGTKLGWDPPRLVPVALRDPDQARVEGVVVGAVGRLGGRVDQLAELVRRRPVVMEAGKGSELLGAHRSAPRRHLRAFVPGEQGHRTVEVGEHAEGLSERCDRLIHCRNVHTAQEWQRLRRIPPRWTVLPCPHTRPARDGGDHTA